MTQWQVRNERRMGPLTCLIGKASPLWSLEWKLLTGGQERSSLWSTWLESSCYKKTSFKNSLIQSALAGSKTAKLGTPFLKVSSEEKLGQCLCGNKNPKDLLWIYAIRQTRESGEAALQAARAPGPPLQVLKQYLDHPAKETAGKLSNRKSEVEVLK